jgi:hypothetical protein
MLAAMTYQVQFLRTGVVTERSELFETFHAAHVFAAQEVARREPKPKVVAVVEIDDDGNPGRVHEIQVL